MGRLELFYVDGLELSSPRVSVNLPTQSKPYRGEKVTAFFNGLLPDGEAQRVIGYDLGIDATDLFGGAEHWNVGAHVIGVRVGRRSRGACAEQWRA